MPIKNEFDLDLEPNQLQLPLLLWLWLEPRRLLPAIQEVVLFQGSQILQVQVVASLWEVQQEEAILRLQPRSMLPRPLVLAKFQEKMPAPWP